MKMRLKRYLPALLLVLIAIILCATNYTPGTWLSGWDTLHPEFNFGLNFQRLFFGVFRTEQGLGAVAAHSSMADLPRVLILYIFHFVLPLSFLRYFYIFLNLIFGVLGMYIFLKNSLIKNVKASFLGALFYLLNLGTLQIFNVPFEMFTTLFATLPFIFYFATKFIQDENRTKSLFFFSIFTLLNTPSAYAATLWYVFFLAFLSYFFVFSFIDKKHRKIYLERFIILVFSSILINLFWLIPNIYFALTHGTEVQTAAVNLLFSDQAFLKNKEFGNLLDILFLKNFYFDWSIFNGKAFIELLSAYISFLKFPIIYFLGLFFGILIILGAVSMALKERLKSLPILTLSLFTLFLLFNDNFPFSHLFALLQNNLPLFKEALRFPGDKILNIEVFLASIFFAFAALFLLEKLDKLNKKASLVTTFILALLIIGYNFPSFSGNFINKAVRVRIPNYYFQLFSYLNTQNPNGKVANLPINSPFGWVYYNWGNQPSYQGSGFLYFGIKQPLLDRDFDRWSSFNESYYRELSHALYSQDQKLFSKVLEKYDISFLFIDRSVIDSNNQSRTLYFDQAQKLVEGSGLVLRKQNFGSITLYELKSEPLISSINTNLNIKPATTTTYDDFAYEDLGNYVTSDNLNGFSTVTFPFRNFIDNQSKVNPQIVKITPDEVDFTPLIKIANYQSDDLKNIPIIPAGLIIQKSEANLTFTLYPNTPVFGKTPSSRPISGVLNNASALTFNQNEFFDLSKLPIETPFAVGKVNLKNDDNNIFAFDTSNQTMISSPLHNLNPIFSSCDAKNLPPQAIITQDNLEIRGKGNICILMPLTLLANAGSGETLLNLQFDYQGSSSLNSCLFDQASSSCIYYRLPEREGTKATFNYPVSNSNANQLAVKIFLQNSTNEQSRNLLGNLSVSSSLANSSVILSKQLIQSMFNDIRGSSFNTISLPKSITYDPGFQIVNVNNFQNDCIANPDEAKKEIVTYGGTKVIQYQTSVNSYCDHFSYPNLLHSQGYLISIESKNLKGLPLTFCVNNYISKRCDIYSNLTAFKNSFGKDIFLLPPMDRQGIGYDVNLENIGIKGSEAVNLVKSIDFIPIPYDFFQNIKTNVTSSTNTFHGKLIDAKQINPLLFVAKTDGNSTILNLNYSFEESFRAYQISCSNSLSCLIKENLAPIFGKEQKQHILVNNWSNGWIVSANNYRNSQIVIVFIPQYFEHVGFLVLTIFLLSILSFHYKTRI